MRKYLSTLLCSALSEWVSANTGWDRDSTYTVGSSLLSETVEENGRTYHVYKDGSSYP